MVGNHVADIVARYGADGANVPTALTDYIKGREGYDYNEHGRAGNTHTSFVPDEIVDRFCVIGTLEEHLAKLDALRALGVSQFAIYLQHDAQDETLRAYGQHVVPAVAERVRAEDVTAAAGVDATAYAPLGGALARRALGRVALVAAAVAVVGLIWTGYKAMGAATGDVWPGTSRPLPGPDRRHDAAPVPGHPAAVR